MNVWNAKKYDYETDTYYPMVYVLISNIISYTYVSAK